MTLPPWPHFEPDEVAAATAVLESGRVNAWTGDDCRAFEAAYAAACDVEHALCLANGSLALEAALGATGIEAGDDVLVTPRSFVASASSVVARHARPVFADVDRDSGNVTAATLEAARTPGTRAAIVVHLGGWPCDMPAILAWARTHGIVIIEDAAQAHGAAIDGQPIGSHGHAAAFSFCQDKIISTGGDGGMLTTRDETIFKRAWSLREHGKSWDAVHRTDHPPGFRWLIGSFGSNWRMTGPQAAIGSCQLRKLPDWIARRTRNARLLHDALDPLPAVRSPWPGDDLTHAWYRYYCYVEPDALASDWSRDRIMNEINAAGWSCRVGSCPEIYREPAMVEAGFAPARRLPVAQELGETSLAMMVHHTIDADTMAAYARDVAAVVERASR